MFYYFGRKGFMASSYPEPLYPIVIEPFAGSMAYTLHHRPDYAIGIEANERVSALWRRLCHMSYAEIKAMPVPGLGDRTDDLYWMLAFASNHSLDYGYRTVNAFIHKRLPRQKQLTLRHHQYALSKVLYRCGDYTEAPDIEATWFVDPPYVHINHGYKHGPDDYAALAEWCLTRKGQVIVCEGAFGDWLAFQELGRFRGFQNVSNRGSKNRINGGVLLEKVWLSKVSVCHAPRCERRFKPTKASHVYCSTRCRVAAHREAGRNA